MKNNRRLLAHIICIVFGIALCFMGFTEYIDEFWGGMGSALILVGALRIARMFHYYKNPEYRERVETEANDERSRFIRNKAWAWAGYLFVIIAGIAVIILKVIHQDLLSMATGCAMCLIVLLYWVSYMVLKKKY